LYKPSITITIPLRGRGSLWRDVVMVAEWWEHGIQAREGENRFPLEHPEEESSVLCPLNFSTMRISSDFIFQTFKIINLNKFMINFYNSRKLHKCKEETHRMLYKSLSDGATLLLASHHTHSLSWPLAPIDAATPTPSVPEYPHFSLCPKFDTLKHLLGITLHPILINSHIWHQCRHHCLI
jgi:hypothetical protein